MDPVSALSIAAAAVQFTDQAATIFMVLFKYCRQVKRAPKLSADLRKEVQLISEVLDELKSALEVVSTISQSATHTRFQDVVDEFAKTMNDMANCLEPIQKSEMTKRLKWPFTQKENEEYLAKFVRYKDTFILALHTIQR